MAKSKGKSKHNKYTAKRKKKEAAILKLFETKILKKYNIKTI